MRERFTLRAWPLTPIHVGSGLELTPESFVLEGDRLRSFNPFGALARASEAEREQYRALLTNDNLANAQKHLARLAARETRGGDQGIKVSGDSLADLEKVLGGNPDRGTGRVQPFVRGGETPILPGSSLKGAFRTAWISAHVKQADGRRIAAGISDTRTARAHQDLNQVALDMDNGRTLEQDPFRDLAVADAAIPAGRTRFDRATLGKRDKELQKLNIDQTGGIQMHVERLESLADGQPVEPLVIDIDVISAKDASERARQGTRHGKRIVPETLIDAPALWAAANRFHADLWLYERGRFYAAAAGQALDRLLAAFGLKGDPDLAGQLDRAGLILLRVGRYAHFESKSVKVGGERHGLKIKTFNKQTRVENPARLIDEGVTRTTVQVAPGLYAPFGWLMLALPGKGPNGAPRVDFADLARATAPTTAARVPAGRPAPAAPVQATAALAGTFRFQKGDRVTHPDQDEATVVRSVGLNDSKMDVDFGFGDGAEPVSVEGWRKA